ncbi:MAG TPA: rhodanese-like domain-containing protein [Humibacter sp.]|nr:rhodanese-like domain-containing protein [Humibacter sp.]
MSQHEPASDRPATSRHYLVSTDELAALLAEHASNEQTDARRRAIVVLDATVLPVAGFDGHPSYVTGDEQYLVSGHIPGAVFADLISAFSDPDAPRPFTRPDAVRFASAAAALGIKSATSVVVYDAAIGQWAARLWWLFRSFGHDDVAVLDGGLRKWEAEDRPIEVGHVAPIEAAGFGAVERGEFWADKQRVLQAVSGEAPATLVCGIPPREFTGEAGHRQRLGHIPGSFSAPAARLVDRETNAFLSDDALREVLADVVASPDPIVAYCAAGIAATSDALALAVLGRDDVSVYDGSLNEWAADAEAPLVLSAHPPVE